MTHEEYMAVEKFATDLKTCYEAKIKNIIKRDSVVNDAIRITLHYAINIINLHLQLTGLKRDGSIAKEAEALDVK